LYGVKNAADWQATSIQDIKGNANFGLTWDGFFLKNDNGSVEISSDNDI
jgi:hypothetical protein